MGSIETGKIANFTVLKDDIFSYPVEKMGELEAEKMGELEAESVYFEGKKR